MINSEIEITILAPDQLIRIELGQPDVEPNHSRLTIVDTTNGQKRTFTPTDAQLVGILALTITDDIEIRAGNILDALVGNLFDGVPQGLRPIP